MAAGHGPREPVYRIMSAPLATIREHAQVYEALLPMEEKGVQHLAVTDDAGRTVGARAQPGTAAVPELRRHRARRARSPAPRPRRRSSRCCRRTPDLVQALLDCGAHPHNITRMISSVCDAATERFVALATGELGPPPGALRLPRPRQPGPPGADAVHRPGQRHHLRRLTDRGRAPRRTVLPRAGPMRLRVAGPGGLPALPRRCHGAEPALVPAAGRLEADTSASGSPAPSRSSCWSSASSSTSAPCAARRSWRTSCAGTSTRPARRARPSSPTSRRTRCSSSRPCACSGGSLPGRRAASTARRSTSRTR